MVLMSKALVAPDGVHLIGLESTNLGLLMSSHADNPIAMFGEYTAMIQEKSVLNHVVIK